LNKLLQNYGILLAIWAGITHFFLSNYFSEFAEYLYFSKLYVCFKWLLWPLHALPFPILYAFVGFILIVFGVGIFRVIKKRVPLVKACRELLNILGFLFFLFYVTWGFNYSLPSLLDRLDWQAPAFSSEQLMNLYQSVTDEMVGARIDWVDSRESSASFDHALTEVDVGLQLEFWLKEYGLHIPVPAKIRPLHNGFLLRISTAGFYFPFGGEGYWDKGLHDLVVPFVIAHELAHNYGITNEGEANFVAYRTCIRSDDPFIRYSGFLNFWRYVAGQLRQADAEIFSESWACVPAAIKNDLEEIRKQHGKYPDIFPQIRDAIYDSFLKAQGVQAGLSSYGEVVQLELAFRNQENSPY